MKFAITLGFCLTLPFIVPPAAAESQPPIGSADAAKIDIPPLALKRKNFDQKMLDPVEGVSLRAYCHAAHALFREPKAPKDEVLAKFGLTSAQFDKANEAFGKRMKDDFTRTMIDLFGAYFYEQADGAYAAYARDTAQSVLGDGPLLKEEPMSEDQFREMQIYYGRKVESIGVELEKQDEVLRPYNITFDDFNILGAWFGRRWALNSDPSPEPVARPAEAVPENDPKLAGRWEFSWQTLQRTDSGMKIFVKSQSLCWAPDMKAEQLPMMPKPAGARCFLIHNDMRDDFMQIQTRCDHGDWGTSWGLTLERDRAGTYTGDLQYTVQNEKDQTPHPNHTTVVTARRIGDCS